MKLVDDPKQLLKAYSTWALIANILTALSTAALAVLGVISVYFSMWVVIGSATLFGLLGLLGRFLKQDLEDGKLFWDEEGILQKKDDV